MINSHNSWSQLEEVWLGDVYPSSWYDHLPGEIRDVFYRITEITQEDLSIIQRKLEEFQVTVRRPVYESIDDFIDYRVDQLVKPEICPRDTFVTIGNTLFTPIDVPACWRNTTDYYISQGYQVQRNNMHYIFNGANIVRAGRDIVIDIDMYRPEEIKLDFPAFKDYRVALEMNGGHLDGCFAILKPGLILANHYFDGYDRTFPGWEVIMLDAPTYQAAPSTGHRQPYPVYNGKFYIEGMVFNRAFNQHVIEHAQNWVGDYTETYFELNCLSINESNVLMLAENHQLAEDLHRRGITVHWVPFRCRSFWDGGMHCLTVDIRRQSSIEDYFPERG